MFTVNVKKILYTIFFLILFVSTAFSAEYYVDHDCGSPGNGTTGTCNGANGPFDEFSDYTDLGGKPACGDTVYIKDDTILRGGESVENLTCTAGNDLVIDNYGDGTNIPIVTSRIRSTAEWSQSGDVYYIDVGSGPQGFWAGNSGSDTWGKEIREAYEDSTPADGYWGEVGNVIYYNPSVTQPNPDDGDFFFEWSKTGKVNVSGIYINNCDYITINDMNSIKNRYHGLVIENSSHITGYRNKTDYNGASNHYYHLIGYISIGNGIECQGSGNINFYDGTSNYNYDNGGGQESAWDAFTGDINFYNYQMNYNGSSGGYNKNDDTSPTKSLAVNYYRSEFGYNGNATFPGQSGTPNCYSHVGIKYYENSHGTVKNCWIHDNYGAGIDLRDNDRSGWTTNIINNVFYNNTRGDVEGWPVIDRGSPDEGSISIADNYGNAGETINIYGNTIIDDNMYGVSQYGSSDVADLNIKNNIITGCTDEDIRLEATPGTDMTVALDTNLYSSTLNNYINNGTGDYSVLATWNNLSYVGDDLAETAYLDTDYTLLYNSPAIDNGTDLDNNDYDDAVLPTSTWPDSVTTGLQGSYGTGWEIGAFIYIPGGAASGTLSTGFSGSNVTESQIIAGLVEGNPITIILTLSSATWDADLAGDNAVSTAFIAGFDSAQAEAGGWNATIRDVLTFAAISRDSDTQATLTIPATVGYSITANETITITIDSSCTSHSEDIVASGNLTVSNEISAPTGLGLSYNANGKTFTPSANGVNITIGN